MKAPIYAAAILSLSMILSVAGFTKNHSKQIIKRYALIVGANNGGRDRVRLRYAVTDANSFKNVLEKLGGIQAGDGMMLIDPTVNDIKNYITMLNQKVVSAKKRYRRVEFIFYYSGHSDEEGILLSGKKMYYREMKRHIMNVPADVRIAILDSCSSGAFTRIKGGKKRSPFLMDSSYDMKGFAFMTSSSSDEASQESDRIRGSFFTYYLITGLRGAADLTHDGRITLSEVYQYAYNETLARTEKTLRGAQHPNYQIKMSGAGDVVITDVRKGSARLIIQKPLSGKIFIRNRDNVLVAEVKKVYGKKMDIALESGNYRILNERNNNIYETDIYLGRGRSILLAAANFKKVSREMTRSRGEKNETDLPFIQKGGFIDSYFKISVIACGGVLYKGLFDKERKVLNVFEPDLIQINGIPQNFNLMNYFIGGGVELDGMFPAVKFKQKRKYDLTGIKVGIRVRYGFQRVQSVVSGFNNSDYNNFISNNNKLMQYHYWSSGPVVNLIFSPRSNVFNILVNAYVMGGQIFSGMLKASAGLRSESRLALLYSGLIPGVTPYINFLNVFHHSRFSNTGFRGYTIRFGIGPHFVLNRHFPLVLGVNATYGYSRIILNRAPFIYYDGDKKLWHNEWGGEISLGIHI